MIYLCAICCAVLIVVCVVLNRKISILNVDKTRLEIESKNKDAQIIELNNEIKVLQSRLETTNKEHISINNDKIRLEADNETKDRLIAELRQSIKETQENYKEIFENLKKELKETAKTQDEIAFERVKNMFNEDSKKMLENIFDPIKKSVKEYSENLKENEIAFKQHIKDAFAYSHKAKETAEELSMILKGDKKLRGKFGELQLKSVLESSGLIEGEQYQLQAHFKQESKGYMPDAVVFLDGDIGDNRRCIIIDSKFPLPDSFTPTLDSSVEIDEHTAKEIAKNLKNRIDELFKKPYSEYSDYTYDFTLLFVPYNNILDLAIWADSQIYQYAYSKKIYLVTPHTLFMALKTINISWIHNKREKSVQQAFEFINNIYDKFAIAMGTLEKIKNQAESLRDNIGILDGQLISGKGSLSNRFEELKDYGAMPKKSLPTR